MEGTYTTPVAQVLYVRTSDILTASPEDKNDDFANDIF